MYPTGYPLGPYSNKLLKQYLYFSPYATSLPSTNVEVDASCSGIGICAGLLGDETLLKLTNIVTQGKNQPKKDFYTYLLKVMKNIFLRKNQAGLKSLKGYSELHGITLKLLESRELGKFFSMKYTYNETIFTRLVNLKKLYKCQWELLKLSEDVYKSITRFSVFLEKIFREAMADISPLIVAFIKLLSSTEVRDAVKINKCFFINNDLCEFSFSKPLYKSSKTSIYKDGRKTTTTLKIPVGDISVSSTLRSILPNFVHSKDSCILIKCILLCKDMNVAVHPQHDSLTCDVSDKEKVIKSYGDSYQTAITNSQFDIRELLMLNKVVISPETEVFLCGIEANRKSISEKIKTGVLQMSINILS